MPNNNILHPITISKNRILTGFLASSYAVYIISRLILELRQYFTDNYASKIILGYTICYIIYMLIQFNLLFRKIIHGIKNGFNNERISATNDLYGHNRFNNFLIINCSGFISSLMFILNIIIVDICFRKKAYLDDINQYSVITIISIVFLVVCGLIFLFICLYCIAVYSIRNNNIVVINSLNTFINNRLASSIRESIPLDMSRFEKTNAKDNICAYCTCEIEKDSGVRGTCNKEHIFHNECVKTHRQFCIDKRETFRCPLCRESWETRIV